MGLTTLTGEERETEEGRREERDHCLRGGAAGRDGAGPGLPGIRPHAVPPDCAPDLLLPEICKDD